ncbi:hypothetical protein PQQ51_04460 [Paraburkholderia xenovorans]|uniref:hypothetical protein n=1 Tax=Paraburkholderia xenovorans TaxID=36873 RepID=UPI0038BB09B5
MSEYVQQIRRDVRRRPAGPVLAEARTFTRQDTQCAVQSIVRLARQDPERAFTCAMHVVASQLAGDMTQAGHTALSLPADDSRLAGMLHRPTAHRMVCFPSVTAVRDGSVWKLSADALLAVSPASVQRWYVLAHTDGGNIDAFWFDTDAVGIRRHAQPADARLTPFNAHTFSLDGVCVPEAARIRLGHVHAPGPMLQRVALVYRAMASALCCGIGYATRSVASLHVGAPVRASIYLPDRQRATEHLSRIDALLLTSEVSLRDIASDLLKSSVCTPPRRSVQHLHRLALDSSIAAISLAARAVPKVSNVDRASLHRHRRDAAATCALAANFDLVHAATA